VGWLFVIVVALLSVVVVLSVIRGVPLREMVPLVLVLLMGAAAVALPVMFTVSMAVGSKELARRGVLVTRLSAVEDAATMDVLCVDRSGKPGHKTPTGVFVLLQKNVKHISTIYKGASMLCWSQSGRTVSFPMGGWVAGGLDDGRESAG
jgi:hypothetical protein